LIISIVIRYTRVIVTLDFRLVRVIRVIRVLWEYISFTLAIKAVIIVRGTSECKRHERATCIEALRLLGLLRLLRPLHLVSLLQY
jgi:hypothetical protein